MGKINVYEVVIENDKQRKYGNQRKLDIISSNRWLRNRNHSLLKRADTEEALTSFTVCDACRSFAGHALLMTSQSRSRIEY